MSEIKQIELSMIDPPDTPARMAMDDKKLDELRTSMAQIGLLQPIGIVAKDGRYEIEYGHRRFVCACALGWATITAMVYQPAEVASGAAMLAENIYHEELSAAEEAILFQEHRERYNLDEAGLCARFKVTPDYLGERLRLLRGDPVIFDVLLKRGISFAVARSLNRCEDEAHRRYLLDIAVRTGYSSRVMDDHVRQWRQNQAQFTAPAPPASAPAPVEVAPADRMECAICGGYRDPWRLVSVWIHSDELAAIKKQLETLAKGDS